MVGFSVAASSIKAITCCLTVVGRDLNAFLARRIRRLCGIQTTTKSPTIPKMIPNVSLPPEVLASVTMLAMTMMTTTK